MSDQDKNSGRHSGKDSGSYHHGNLRQALVESAISVIESDGLGALSLRRIAREAGVSPAAPYTHFRDKKELLAAVCITGYERFSQQMSDAAGDAAGAQYIAGLGRGYIHFALENPGLFHLMSSGQLSEIIDKEDTVPEAFSNGYELLVNGINNAPLSHLGTRYPELDIPLAWSIVHGLAYLLLDQRITPEQFGYQSTELFVKHLVDKSMGLVADPDQTEQR